MKPTKFVCLYHIIDIKCICFLSKLVFLTSHFYFELETPLLYIFEHSNKDSKLETKNNTNAWTTIRHTIKFWLFPFFYLKVNVRNNGISNANQFLQTFTKYSTSEILLHFFSNILFFDDDVSRNPSCPGMLGEVLKKQDSNAFPQ